MSKRDPVPAMPAEPRRARSGAAMTGLSFVAGLAASVVCAGAAFADGPPRLPPLVDPPSQERHVGKVVLVELITPDRMAAERFYGGLFGWTFRDVQYGSIRYAEAALDGAAVAGLVERALPAAGQRHPAWLGFMSVRDVDATRELAVQNGAKVLFKPHDVPARGREAVFADPQGAVFAVVASSSGDPPDDLANPGEWIWSSLLASDLDADAAFYQNLFDYEVFDLPDASGHGSGNEHVVLSSDDVARASANAIPGDWKGVHPHWLNFVRVEDAAKSAARVTALGGKVLVPPHPDRQGGTVAVVADPQGAAFGLLEWSDSEPSTVSRLP